MSQVLEYVVVSQTGKITLHFDDGEVVSLPRQYETAVAACAALEFNGWQPRELQGLPLGARAYRRYSSATAMEALLGPPQPAIIMDGGHLPQAKLDSPFEDVQIYTGATEHPTAGTCKAFSFRASSIIELQNGSKMTFNHGHFDPVSRMLSQGLYHIPGWGYYTNDETAIKAAYAFFRELQSRFGDTLLRELLDLEINTERAVYVG